MIVFQQKCIAASAKLQRILDTKSINLDRLALTIVAPSPTAVKLYYTNTICTAVLGDDVRGVVARYRGTNSMVLRKSTARGVTTRRL